MRKRSIKAIERPIAAEPEPQRMLRTRSRDLGAQPVARPVEDVSAVRARQEHIYVQKAQEGKRMRKNKDQM